MTYHELAEIVLNKIDRPLAANEIWEIAVSEGLDKQLDGKGKTPWATLAARLYVISRDNPDSKFLTIGQRPKRFYLKGKLYDKELVSVESDIEIVTDKEAADFKYLEKDLHAVLSDFAFYYLSCYTKTINHSTSEKKSYGEWVHPDIVGCVFLNAKWESNVTNLSRSLGHTSVKLVSFELKRELNLHSLRENFFQTVSNSSWANESYLVAAKISKNDDFMRELERLSAAFGIGVIQLDLRDSDSSEVILPARTRESLDWETINKLTMNKDFSQFLKRVKIDVDSNEIRKEWYNQVSELTMSFRTKK